MSTRTDKISIAGDVRIDDVTIITSQGLAQNVSEQLAAIEIYEDIFSNFITGKLYLRDSQELTNFLPLIGEEVLRLSVSTPSLPESDAYTGEYMIYKMDDKIKTAEREVMYVLHFITKEAIVDINKKLSKAYGGKVSDIAKTLITDVYGLESKKLANVEETKNQTKFISNWWRPSQCLQYACDTAVNTNDSPSYVFFENKYGLNFISLETLYTGSPIKQRFIWDQYTREVSEASGTASRDIEKDYQRVLELDTPSTYNYMERLQSGMYGSELITYDILTKQYVHVGYMAGDPEKDGNVQRLNANPLWSNNRPALMKGVMIYGSKYYNNFDGFDDVTNTRTVQKRKSLMAQAEGYKVNITVFGRTDYSAGQRVYLSVPKNTQIKQNDDPEDKILSGNYLVAALCHFITRESHQCVMELIKDSYMVNLNDTR